MLKKVITVKEKNSQRRAHRINDLLTPRTMAVVFKPAFVSALISGTAENKCMAVVQHKNAISNKTGGNAADT